MFSKRQVLLGGVVIALSAVMLTVGAFLYFLGLISGNVLQTAKFLRALQVVKKNYIGDVSAEKMMDGAIGGLVRALDDPHSMYISGELLRRFRMVNEGHFGGIGVVVGMKNDFITVVAPIEGTPGAAAGIKSGDRIIKIDGEDTRDMPLDVAVNKIRGEKDTLVELELLTEEDERRVLKIMRASIKMQTVSGHKLEDGIGYIRVTMFSEQTYEDFARQLNELEQEGAKGIVLDLRDNPGGTLEASARICGLLTPKGPVVSVVGKNGDETVFHSNNAAPKYVLAVLVNGGSASASEVVAGAIQDTGVGTLIGTKTYGKASVQGVWSLDNNSALKLTAAQYYTPAGREINGVGLEPDIELPRSEAGDNQLQKAIEVLREKLGK